MYCPIDKTKLLWLCFTLAFLFTLVIHIPTALLSNKQPKSDKCLWDDECFNSRLGSSKTIEDLSWRAYELLQIFIQQPVDRFSPINPTTGRRNETVTSNQNVDIPITSTKTTSTPTNESVSQPDTPTSQTPCQSSAFDGSNANPPVTKHRIDPSNTSIIARNTMQSHNNAEHRLRCLFDR